MYKYVAPKKQASTVISTSAVTRYGKGVPALWVGEDWAYLIPRTGGPVKKEHAVEISIFHII